MKKLMLLMLLIFPVALFAQEQGSPFEQGIYQMKILVSGQMAPGQDSGGAITEQTINGMSFEGYTVAYTAVIDAIRTILTQVWALENMDAITDAKLKELVSNPKVLYTQ